VITDLKDNLPDIQGTEPEFQRPIQQVGVSSVKLPMLLQGKDSDEFYSIPANVSLRVSLKDSIKGISMSRLTRALIGYLDKPLKKSLIKVLLNELCEKVESEHAFIKFEFELPINRDSPISDYSFPIYHKCSFEGHLENGNFRFFQKTVVQYSSYCPCSTELCRDLGSKGHQGFPHAQRCFAHVTIEQDVNNTIWLEDIIHEIETAAVNLPIVVIKRPDEQELARIAGTSQFFVEDVIRRIGQNLDSVVGVKDYYIKCIHEESIHTSDAIAIMYKGVPGGFDNTYDFI